MFLFCASSVSALAGDPPLDVLATVHQVTATDTVIVCFGQGGGGCNTSCVSFQ